MAEPIASAYVELVAQTDKFEREVRQAGDDIGDNVERGVDRADSSLGKLARNAAFTVLGAQAVRFFKDSIGGASDLAETTSKVETVFGGQADAIKSFAADAATALGQSKQEAMDAAATFAIFGQSAGLSGAALTTFSTDLTGLASDLASFNNTTPQQAIEALGSALRGEAEPIRAYGVMLDEATLKQAAMDLGIQNANGTLTAQEKILAAQKAIFDQTGLAQGDFARTSEGVANQTRIAAAEFANLRAELGEALVPVFGTLLDVARGVLGFFTGLPPGVQKVIVIIGAAGAAFVAASNGLQTLGVSASTANKALGAIALTITVGAGIYSALSGAKKEQQAVTESYTAALRAEASGQKDAIAAAQAAQITGNDQLQLYDELGLSATDLAKIINGEQVPAFDALRAKYEQTKDGSITAIATQKELEEQYGKNAQGIGIFVRAVDDQRGALELARVAFADQVAVEKEVAAQLDVTEPKIKTAADRQAEATAATETWNAALGLFSTVSGTYQTAIEDQTAALEAERKAIEDAEKAQRDLIDAQLAAFSAEIQLEERTWATTDAFNAYTATLWAQIAGTYEGEDAARDLAAAENEALTAALGQAAAAAQLATDQATATGAMLSANETARIQRDELQKVADTLAPDHPLRARLQEYIDELNNKIPKNLQTTVSLDFKADLSRIPASLRSQLPPSLQQYVGMSAVSNAYGSIVDRPILSWVGEAGREAIIPMTRPQRAMELMDVSGLGAMWDRMNSGRGGIHIAAGASIASFPGAIIQDATDVDRVAQRTVAAVTAKALAV